MATKANHPTELYQYEALPAQTSFRVLELLPGNAEDSISCLLQLADLALPHSTPRFEAISYAWGDVNDRVPILCHGRRVYVTRNLECALRHLRYPDRSRYVWADAIW